VISFLTAIWDFLRSSLWYLWRLVNDAFWWVVETCYGYFELLILAILPYVPDKVVEIATEAQVVFALAHHWIALGDVVLWVISYWTFASMFATLKILIKLIPTIG